VSRDHDPETEPDSLDEGGKGSGHILLVDDEQMIRETTHEILVELGYEVTECADGLEGVEQFTRLAPSIDAVVLDLIMPKMGGLECYRAMRKSAPNIPVIVATGYGTSQEEAQIIREGVDGFVRKPYGKREIARALAEVLQTGVGKVTNG
jgi:CheY-like chemotaxis protein